MRPESRINQKLSGLQKNKKNVESKLGKKWSPEQISSTMAKECGQTVSHERIYQHIIEDKKKGGKLYKNLRRRKNIRIE